MDNNKVFIIDSVDKTSNKLLFRGRFYADKVPLYKYPCDSSLFNTFQVKHLNYDQIKYGFENIVCKMLRLKIDSGIFVIPILHTYTS